MWKRTNHRTPALRPPILTHLAIFQPKKTIQPKFGQFFFFGIRQKICYNFETSSSAHWERIPSTIEPALQYLHSSGDPASILCIFLFVLLLAFLSPPINPSMHLPPAIFFSLLLPSAFATNPPSCKPLQTSYNGKTQHFCRPLLSTAYVSVESNQKVWKRTLLNPPICNRSVCLSVYLCIF